MTELLLKEYTATSCIGHGRAATLEALRAERGGLAPCTFETAAIDTWTGEVSGTDAERHLGDLRGVYAMVPQEHFAVDPREAAGSGGAELADDDVAERFHR